MDRRTLLAVTLCFLIFFGWQKFYLEPQMEQTRAQQALQTGAQSGGTTHALPNLVQNTSQGPTQNNNLAVANVLPEEKIELALAGGKLELSNAPALFQNWKLNDFKVSLEPTSPVVDLTMITHQEKVGEIGFDIPELSYLNKVNGQWTKKEKDQAEWVYEDSLIKLTRFYKVNLDTRAIDLKISGQFKQKKADFLFVSLQNKSDANDPEVKDRQLIYYETDSLKRVNLDGGVKLKEISTGLKWIGTQSRYFLIALIPDGPNLNAKGLLQPTGEKSGRVSFAYPIKDSQFEIPFKVYFGPKDLNVLKRVEPTLDQSVDFGMFSFIAFPLLYVMRFFFGVFQNWGVAIILLTLLVKAITYPLTYKSMKSMKEMAKIQPQLQALKEKYANDKEALNREMMTLMKDHGYNPMAGCLPILVQMPVFFALYQVFYSSIELFHSPFIFWIKDLSLKDPYYVTPVLLTVTMFLQQKLTPTPSADPAQQKMMQFMPIMFGAFMIQVPSGLTLYWLVNAVASIGQQLVLNKKFGTQKASALLTQ